MGIDFIDLLARVESSFGTSITIRDEEFPEALTTVGSFYYLILKRLDSDKPQGQVGPIAYESLRHALAAVSGVDPTTIESSTDLSALLPTAGRRGAWRRLESQLGLRLPRLEIPDGIGLLLRLVVVIVGIVVGALEGIFVGLLAFAIAAVVAYRLAQWFAVCFPTRVKSGWIFFRFVPALMTVRDLNEQILAMNYKEFVQRTGRWSPSEVWLILRQILVETLGVEADEITPEARLFEDFGAG